MRLIPLFIASVISFVKADIPEQIFCPAIGPSVAKNLTEDDFLYHWHEVYEQIDNSFRAQKVCDGTSYTAILNDTVQAGLFLVKEMQGGSHPSIPTGTHLTVAVEITLKETEDVSGQYIQGVVNVNDQQLLKYALATIDKRMDTITGQENMTNFDIVWGCESYFFGKMNVRWYALVSQGSSVHQAMVFQKDTILDYTKDSTKLLYTPQCGYNLANPVEDTNQEKTLKMFRSEPMWHNYEETSNFTKNIERFFNESIRYPDFPTGIIVDEMYVFNKYYPTPLADQIKELWANASSFHVLRNFRYSELEEHSNVRVDVFVLANHNETTTEEVEYIEKLGKLPYGPDASYYCCYMPLSEVYVPPEGETMPGPTPGTFSVFDKLSGFARIVVYDQDTGIKRFFEGQFKNGRQIEFGRWVEQDETYGFRSFMGWFPDTQQMGQGIAVTKLNWQQDEGFKILMGRWKTIEDNTYFPNDGNQLQVEYTDFRYIVEDLVTRDVGPIEEEIVEDGVEPLTVIN